MGKAFSDLELPYHAVAVKFCRNRPENYEMERVPLLLRTDSESKLRAEKLQARLGELAADIKAPNKV